MKLDKFSPPAQYAPGGHEGGRWGEEAKRVSELSSITVDRCTTMEMTLLLSSN